MLCVCGLFGYSFLSVLLSWSICSCLCLFVLLSLFCHRFKRRLQYECLTLCFVSPALQPHQTPPNLLSSPSAGWSRFHPVGKREKKTQQQINSDLTSENLWGSASHHLSSVFHNHSPSPEPSLIVPRQAYEFKKKKKKQTPTVTEPSRGAPSKYSEPSPWLLTQPIIYGLADALAWDCFFCSPALDHWVKSWSSWVVYFLFFFQEPLASEHTNPDRSISRWRVATAAVIRGSAASGSRRQSWSFISTHSAFEYELWTNTFLKFKCMKEKKTPGLWHLSIIIQPRGSLVKLLLLTGMKGHFHKNTIMLQTQQVAGPRQEARNRWKNLCASEMNYLHKDHQM